MSTKNSSDKQVLASLKESGFESFSKVKRDIERLIKDPVHQNFFREISAVISSKTVLDASEILRHNALDLHIKQLDSQSLKKHIESVTGSRSEIRHDCETLSKALHQATAYKEQLIKRLQHMQEVKNNLQDKEEELHKTLKHKQAELKKASLLNKHHLEHMDCANVAVVDNFLQLSNVYSQTDSRKQSVLQCNLQEFLELETDFTTHLTKYAKGNFKESSIGFDDETSQSFEIISITSDQLLQDESEHLQEELSTCVKLAINGYSNQKRAGISARAKLASATAIGKLLDDRLSFCELSHSNRTPINLKHIQDGIKKVEGQVTLLQQRVLPQLIAKGIPLHKSHLLTGDYHKKLCKQKYVSFKQNQVITFLLDQCARLSMMWMMLHIEARQGKHSVALAKSLTETFVALREATHQQVYALQSHSLPKVPHKEPKAVIDMRDEAMCALHRSLVGDSAKDAIVWTFQSVADAATNLMDTNRRREIQSRRETGVLHPGIQVMAKAVDQCRSAITSSDGEILCTTPTVSENTASLLGGVNKVKSVLPEVLAKVKTKKETLSRQDSCESMVRDLWVNELTARDLMEVEAV